MGIVGVEHVQLAMPVGEEDVARRFYVGVLGMVEVPKPEPQASRGGCWFEAGAAHVHLGVEEGFRPARKAHPALVVDDLHGLLDSLRAGGVEVRPEEPLAGRPRAFVDDPFGNRIELVSA